MSQSISADLPSDRLDRRSFDRLLRREGDEKSFFRGWEGFAAELAKLETIHVERYTGANDFRAERSQPLASVVDLIGDPRVLYRAALQLRRKGKKAPGRSKICLTTLHPSQLHEMCRELGRLIRSDRYRPGLERVNEVPKGSGDGKRKIILINVEDRVVQRAALLTLRPLFEPRFDPLTFAGRKQRNRDHAIAVAEQLAQQGYTSWLVHDLRDAFGSVPMSRLLDAISQRIPCPRLRELLKLILPPRSRSIGGIKQGGPLSSLALEIYLNKFFDSKWRALRTRREDGLDIFAIRYVDDLLILARDTETAQKADEELREYLRPQGLLFKSSFEDALHDIREQGTIWRPEEAWLGFQYRFVNDQFQINLKPDSIERLSMNLLEAHRKNQSSLRAEASLVNWVGQLGPCAKWENATDVCERARNVAISHGFEEIPTLEQMKQLLGAARGRWSQTQNSISHNLDSFLLTRQSRPALVTSSPQEAHEE